jgi:hypothetical protein
VTPEQILAGRVPPPPSARPLVATLSQYWGHYTKRQKLYAKRLPSPWSFILGSLDDVIAFAAFVMDRFPRSKLLLYSAGTTTANLWRSDRKFGILFGRRGLPDWVIAKPCNDLL